MPSRETQTVAALDIIVMAALAGKKEQGLAGSNF